MYIIVQFVVGVFSFYLFGYCLWLINYSIAHLHRGIYTQAQKHDTESSGADCRFYIIFISLFCVLNKFLE